MTQPITVQTVVRAPIDAVWQAYTTPEAIQQWNFATPDWHCPAASVDLREGGKFFSRMEAKDGSVGFDIEATYDDVVEHERLSYWFGGRQCVVDFLPSGEDVTVRVSFDPEEVFPAEHQRAGWQAILDNFARYIERAR